jgi:hypothetical protein
MCWWEYIYVGKFFVNNYIYYVLRQVTNPQLGVSDIERIESFPAPNVFRIEFFLPGVPEMRNKKEWQMVMGTTSGLGLVVKRWACSWNYVHMAEVCKYVHFSYPYIRKWAKTYIYAFTHISMQRYAQKKQQKFYFIYLVH